MNKLVKNFKWINGLTRNGLVINRVNILDAMQIILTKFAVTVVRLPLTCFIFKHLINARRVSIKNIPV